MKTYPIPGPLLQSIVNYLETKPWIEVNQMLIAVGQIAREIDTAVPAGNGKGEELRP